MIGTTHRSCAKVKNKTHAIDSLYFPGKGRFNTLLAIILCWFMAAAFP